jgi:hypothetical protein
LRTGIQGHGGPRVASMRKFNRQSSDPSENSGRFSVTGN